MYHPERQNNIEGADLPQSVMADAFTNKLAAGTISFSCRCDTRFVGVETRVLARWQKGHYVARTAAYVQQAISGPGQNVFIDHHPAAVIPADELVIGVVEERAVQNWPDQLDHNCLP